MILKPAKDEIRAAVASLMEACRSVERGQVFTFEMMETAAGCRRYEGSWTTIVPKFHKKLLNERGIACRPIINVGYKFCEREEQITYCSRKRQRRAFRQLGRGLAELSNLPVEGLSIHQQKMRAMMIDGMKHERRVLNSTVRAQNREQQAANTIPRRPIPASA